MDSFVGISWESVDGIKTIIGVRGDRLLVHTHGNPQAICDLIAPDRVQKEIDLDTRRLVSHQQTVASVAKKQIKEAEEQAKADFCHGYTDGLSPRSAALAIKTLNKQRSISGVLKPAKHHIESLVSRGYRVSAAGDLHGPDGGFYTQKDLGKTLIDYAYFLSRR